MLQGSRLQLIKEKCRSKLEILSSMDNEVPFTHSIDQNNSKEAINETSSIK